VKPSPFGYVKATSLEHAFDLLSEHGASAKLLAGGQSLIAMLNCRLCAPLLLIDITGLDELSGISREGGIIRICALARHAEVERSPLIAQYLPLIAEAMPHIASPAIRNRGTFGGSVALADPAAELPACCVALEADMIIACRNGERRVAASTFFQGFFETVLGPGDVLRAVEFPIASQNAISSFGELARRYADRAMIGLAAHGETGEHGILQKLRPVFFACGAKPELAKDAAAALLGKPLTAETIRVAQDALSRDLDPRGDLNASREARLHLARVLFGRVMAKLTPMPQ
jgi:aerobic carbon-monoxide dehydrogenase medium subunit